MARSKPKKYNIGKAYFHNKVIQNMKICIFGINRPKKGTVYKSDYPPQGLLPAGGSGLVPAGGSGLLPEGEAGLLPADGAGGTVGGTGLLPGGEAGHLT